MSFESSILTSLKENEAKSILKQFLAATAEKYKLKVKGRDFYNTGTISQKLNPLDSVKNLNWLEAKSSFI